MPGMKPRALERPVTTPNEQHVTYVVEKQAAVLHHSQELQSSGLDRESCYDRLLS
jgi:hypothetical protein